jgi:hypothetical protein
MMSDSLTKLTVNLIPQAVTALELAAQVTEDSRTDVVNRAIQVYDYLANRVADGAEIFIKSPDGSIEKINFL